VKPHPCPDTKPHTRHEWYEGNIIRQDCAGVCAHCLGPLRGAGAIVGGHPVCNPANGLDCYALVAYTGHAMPCDEFCGTARLAAPRDAIDDEEFAAFTEVLRTARGDN
jgi:hypothetical protein